MDFVVAEQIALLRGGNYKARQHAATDLGRLGDSAAVPALTEVLRGRGVDMRCRAAYALGDIGDASAVPALLEAAKDKNGEVRNSAVHALGEIGEPSAIPVLIKALKSDVEYVRARAAEALGKMRDSSAVPALVEALRGERAVVRRHAADSLAEIPDLYVTCYTALARVKIDIGIGIASVPVLIGALNIWDGMFKSIQAAFALNQLGDSTTLPRKILAESRFLPEQRIEILEKLRRIRYRSDEYFLSFVFPDIRTLCQTVIQEEDVETREGALAVLDWLKAKGGLDGRHDTLR